MRVPEALDLVVLRPYVQQLQIHHVPLALRNRVLAQAPAHPQLPRLPLK